MIRIPLLLPSFGVVIAFVICTSLFGYVAVICIAVMIDVRYDVFDIIHADVVVFVVIPVHCVVAGVGVRSIDVGDATNYCVVLCMLCVPMI